MARPECDTPFVIIASPIDFWKKKKVSKYFSA
jgi:hypothetical protein